MDFLTAYVSLEVNDKAVKVQLNEVKKAFAATATDSEKSFRGMETAFGNSISRMVRRYVGFAAAITAAVKSIKGFAEFEKNLIDVSTLLDDQYMYIMPKYSDAIKQLSMDFGTSTTTITRALYNIISAVIPPAQALDVLTVSMKAARAGLADVSEAAYAITGVLNSYGMSAREAARISDILFLTVKKGQTTFVELAPAIGRVSSIAAEAGVSFEEVGAALATITRGGIATTEAVTVLRMALMSLAGNSELSARVAREHGIVLSAEELRTKKLVGMVQELAKVSADARADIIREARARLALNVLIKDMPGFLRDYGLAMNSAGYTQKAFDKQTNTLMFSLERLKESIKVISISIAEAFRDALKDIIDRLVNWLSEHRRAIERWSKIIAAYVSYFKDIMIDFVRYMKEDFSGGVNLAFKITLTYAEGFGDALVVILSGAAARAYRVFIKEFSEGLGKWLYEMGKPDSAFGKLMMLAPGVGAPRLAMMKAGAELMKMSKEKIAPPEPLGPELENILRTTHEKVKELVVSSGIDVTKSNEKLRDNLITIEKDYASNMIEIEQKMLEDMIEADKQYLETHGEVTIEKTKSVFSRLHDWFKTYSNIWQAEIEKRWENFRTAIKSPIESAFEDLIFHGKKFKDFMIDMANAIMMEFIKIQFIKPAAEILAGAVDIFGRAAVGKIVPSAVPVPTAHEGGEVGSLGNTRLVPWSVLSGAKKYHGLKSNEQAIIAERGEVISRGSTGNVVVNLHLNSIDTQTGQQFLARHGRTIANIVQGAVRRNHPSRRG